MRRFWSIKLFRVFGIQLELHSTFLILLAMVAWEGWHAENGEMRGALWFSVLLLLAFVCVVLHELGHCLAARRYNIKIHRILLLPIGGMAQFAHMPRQPGRELIITLAGPAVNYLIAGILWVVLGSPLKWMETPFHYGVIDLFYSLLFFNLVMGIFNLLPIFPMDGGRILRALLALKFSYLTATKTAAYAAIPLAIFGILYALMHNEYLLAVLFAFIFLGGQLEYRMVKRRETFADLHIRDVMRRDFRSLPVEATIGDAVALMRSHLPREILVIDNGAVCAILHPEELKKLAIFKKPFEPLNVAIGPKVSTLQASWPLELFADYLYRQEQNTFPVFHLDRLVGVFDLDEMEEMLTWRQLGKNKPDTSGHDQPGAV